MELGKGECHVTVSVKPEPPMWAEPRFSPDYDATYDYDYDLNYDACKFLEFQGSSDLTRTNTNVLQLLFLETLNPWFHSQGTMLQTWSWWVSI